MPHQWTNAAEMKTMWARKNLISSIQLAKLTSTIFFVCESAQFNLKKIHIISLRRINHTIPVCMHYIRTRVFYMIFQLRGRAFSSRVFLHTFKNQIEIAVHFFSISLQSDFDHHQWLNILYHFFHQWLGWRPEPNKLLWLIFMRGVWDALVLFPVAVDTDCSGATKT